MVDLEQLRRKGTVSGLVSMNTQDEPLALNQVAEQMDVTRGTARQRVEELQEEGLVSEDADMVSGTPTRVFELTEQGTEVAEHLATVLDE